MNGKCKSCASL
jgi:septal ring factor EnvC (AmiA/AmiB activator)